MPHITRDDGLASGGASKAHFVRVDDGGRTFDAVAKFVEFAEHGSRGLASEFLASRLARRFQAPVPRVDIVHLPPGVNVQHDGKTAAPGLATASRRLEDHVNVGTPDQLVNVTLAELAIISVFECWIEASDRGGNMIVSRGAPYSIDHATAFQSGWVGSDPPGTLTFNPWTVARLQNDSSDALAAAATRLEGMTDETIAAALAEVPDVWISDEQRDRMANNLAKQRDMVVDAIRNR